MSHDRAVNRATTWIASIAAAAADTALKHHGCPQRPKRPADPSTDPLRAGRARAL